MSHLRQRLEYGQRLLISYLLMLALPLAALYFAYYNSLFIIEEQTRESNLALLTNSRDVIDARAWELNGISDRMLVNTRVNALLRMDRSIPREDIYKLREAWMDVSRILSANSFIKDFYIVIRNGDVVLSPSAPYIGVRNFYRFFFNYAGMDYDEWLSMIFGKQYRRTWLPAVDIVTSGSHIRALPFMQSMPSDAVDAPYGVLILLVEEERLREQLAGLSIEGGWACVLGGDGRLMTSVGVDIPLDLTNLPLIGTQGFFETDVEGERMLITYTYSQWNRWTYVSAVPLRVLMRRVDGLRRILRGVALATLAAGIALAAYITSRNTKPVREQIPLLRQSFLDRLLTSGFDSGDEISAYLAHIRLALPQFPLAVMLLRVREQSPGVTPEQLETLSSRRAAVRELLNRRGVIGHSVDKHNVAALVSLAGVKEIRAYADEMSDWLREHSPCPVKISMGDPCDDPQGIHASYMQARRAMSYFQPNEPDKPQIAWHADLPTSDALYAFSLRMETQLTHLTMSGDRKETLAFLRRSYEQNIASRELSLEMARQYIIELYNTILKIIAQVPNKDAGWIRAAALINERIADDFPLGAIHAELESLYGDICGYIQSRKRSRGDGIKRGLLDFINARIGDETFSLSSLAAEFKLTDAYVSEYFKEQTGENFSSYLERLRMDRACELLANTDAPILQVASLTGYGSDNTFRRAFKRRFGISPSEYRAVK
jgi:AraC-like DNA-binding protein